MDSTDDRTWRDVPGRPLSGSGGESVWEYPRPPRVERTTRRAWVMLSGLVVADTRRALRFLETGRPPLYFIPSADLRRDRLVRSGLHTWCVFRGMAAYFDVRVGDRLARDAAWEHPWPAAGYEELAGYVAFIPARMDACYVDDEQVTPIEGDSHGGWVTSEIDVSPQRG